MIIPDKAREHGGVVPALGSSSGCEAGRPVLESAPSVSWPCPLNHSGRHEDAQGT